MIQKELQNNPQLANENWERFLPKLPPKSKEVKEKMKAKKKGKRIKKEYTPFPPEPVPSKIDLQLESGEYFMTEKKRKDGRREQKREEKDLQAGNVKKFTGKSGRDGRSNHERIGSGSDGRSNHEKIGSGRKDSGSGRSGFNPKRGKPNRGRGRR